MSALTGFRSNRSRTVCLWSTFDHWVTAVFVMWNQSVRNISSLKCTVEVASFFSFVTKPSRFPILSLFLSCCYCFYFLNEDWVWRGGGDVSISQKKSKDDQHETADIWWVWYKGVSATSKGCTEFISGPFYSCLLSDLAFDGSELAAFIV